MTAELTEARLLDIWETGNGQEPPARALLLAAAAAALPGPAGNGQPGPQSGAQPDPRPVAERTLAARNALLLDLRERCFGTALPCVADCPHCAEQLDVTLTTAELRPPGDRTAPPGGAPATGRVRVDGHEVTYRALTGGDLLAVDPGAPGARRALLCRCVLGAVPPAPEGPNDAVLEAVAERLGALDPGADTAVALTCPYCRHGWTAAFDLAGYLWAEVEAYARRLLHEVHLLARAYGWTEADVLGASPVRRRYYLEAATG
ncbi:hypothetical protein [Streptomyces sp. NBC_01233]|uniref:hypothetical protein n=1 Tax=Streptomyces sp. NBC_01233 TaxID=2903787 RepID=UPI002E1011B0|nr:hypothetical protein OG332_38655 [Streptomyces sp. NBC_01233]